MSAVTLGQNVYRIPTQGDFINSFAFLEDDGSVTLVDTGTRFATPRILRGLAAIGKAPEDVQRVVLTHAHPDHAGSAAKLLPKTRAEGATVHVEDAGFVRRGTPPPGGASPVAKVYARVPWNKWAPVPVAEEVQDGTVLDVAGGVRVLHTPGHTPGHISLLHEDSGVLITGDSIFNMLGRMRWSYAAFCSDFPLSQQTAAVFADADYSLAAFTHGPEIRDRAREQLRGFLRRKGVVA